MPKPTSFLRMLTERGPLLALATAGAILMGVAGPASAQFFDFFDRRPAPPPRPAPGGPPGGGFYSPFGDGFPAAPPRAADSSRAPAAARRETPAERNILVLGDAMADWLAYGLEDVFSESPEFGIVRKHKTVSGLIKYQPKGEPSDWVAAAKQIIATENPEAIVVMLGINDRIPIREPAVEKKTDAKPGADGKKSAKKSGDDNKADAAAGDKKTADKPDDEAAAADKAKPAEKPDDKNADAELADDDDDQAAAAPKPRPANGIYDFRDERWVELYSKKIADMIAVLKTKNVPVLWVGLPAIKGTKSTADMLFLDSLYRDAAGKAGITYVDIWDGFVDEAGRYIQQGPDFEGQTRRLRSSDNVYFTKAGARKLALFTEREIRRVLASRSGPVALPSETLSPGATNIRPGVAGPRPLAGPVLPLVASSVGGSELLGGAGSRPAAVDALAARTLVKGEALAAPAGRADDYAWPRRDIGRLDAPAGDAGVALLAPDGSVAPLAAPKIKKRAPTPNASPGLFSFDPNRLLPSRPRPAPSRDGFPRPPASVGPSASVPGFFTR